MYEARNGTPCSVVIRQAANEALLSTENTSSITMNADVNWNAYSRAASDVQYFLQGRLHYRCDHVFPLPKVLN